MGFFLSSSFFFSTGGLSLGEIYLEMLINEGFQKIMERYICKM